MKEEVTMVIADTTYLELCKAFNAQAQRHTEDSDFFLRAEEQNSQIIQIYGYLKVWSSIKKPLGTCDMLLY